MAGRRSQVSLSDGAVGYAREFSNLFQFDKVTDLALGALGRTPGGGIQEQRRDAVKRREIIDAARINGKSVRCERRGARGTRGAFSGRNFISEHGRTRRFAVERFWRCVMPPTLAQRTQAR